MTEKILIVDDDANIVRALERTLRREKYDILKTDDGEKALKLIKLHDFAAIICDQSMPGMTGIEVLKESISIRPYAGRIILTGIQDLETIVEAINVGQVSQFIFKPWDETVLRQAVANAVEKYKLLNENANLNQRILAQHEELAETHDNLRRELQIGGKIHDVLLVGQLPDELSGIQADTLTIPSQEIDGDFWSLLRPSKDVIDIVIGDVMGKGLPAALVGTAVKMQLMRFATPTRQYQVFNQDYFWEPNLLSPKEILSHVQKELSAQLLDLGFFVTLFYARLDLKSQVMTYVDAGAPKPIHVSHGDGQVTFLQGDNFPLGVVEDDDYKEVKVPFRSNDLFLFYSDGVTEAQTDEGKLFGTDQLQTILGVNHKLPPRSVVHTVRQSVVSFSGKQHLDDDLTLMAIRIDPNETPETSPVRSAKFSSDLAQLEAVREFVRIQCLRVPGDRDQMCSLLQLAINEAFCNIVKHSYQEKTGREILIRGETGEDGITIELADQGEAFNPSEVSEPSLAGDRYNGFGVYMIRDIADHIVYSPKDSESGWNRLHIYKEYLRGVPMDLQHAKEDDVLIVTLQGQSLDAREAPKFKDMVTALIDTESTENLVFDLTDLQFIDSSGLGSFLSVLRHVNNRGGDLKLACMTKPIRTMFEVVRMHKLFEVFNSTDDALRSFQGQR